MKFFSTLQLGENRALTPEGFLLCLNVPIARTGVMFYGPGEVPISTGNSDRITVYRDETEVFKEEFINSFNGKPVVNDHPYEDVNPTNWKKYAIGVVMNPRRGSGIQSDLLIADLLITDADAIELIKDGKVEVSCGYDADYEEVEPGVGKQLNMIGNHLALVEAGRCGSRCAIGDSKFREEAEMKFKDEATTVSKLIRKRLVKAFHDKDEKEMKEALDEMEEVEKEEKKKSEDDIYMNKNKDNRMMSDEEIENRFQSLEKGHKQILDALEELKNMEAEEKKAKDAEAEKEKEEEEKKKAEEKAKDEEEKEMEAELKEETGDSETEAGVKVFKDSSKFADVFQETVAAAEILVPGIRIPTFDAAAAPKDTYQVLCNLRRSTLDMAYMQPETRGIIEEIQKQPFELLKMSCGQVRNLFKSSVLVKKERNKAKDQKTPAAGSPKVGAIKTAKDLNAFYADYYKNS